MLGVVSTETIAVNLNESTGGFTVTVLSAEEQLDNLILDDLIQSLKVKLVNAAARLEADGLESTCGLLEAFINDVQALSGKKLPEEDANALIAQANQIKVVIGCP